MIARYGNMPVKIPSPCASIGESVRFAREVREALMQLRDRPVIITPPPNLYPSEPCPFGRIKDLEQPVDPIVILGGPIICGDKNFAVDDYPVDTAVDGEWLVEISIDNITFNIDDDASLTLPGIKTSTGTPAWNKIAYTGTENYTSNVNPTTPTGTGTVVLPVGVLTVTGSVATLEATGCGPFFVDQCAGVFSHSRI